MTVAELIVVRQVAGNYRDMSASLELEASEKKLQNMPLSSRIVREWARICRRAAIAEMIDAEPTK